LQLFVKATQGEDIDEDEDIDKQIELLKIELKSQVIAKEKRTATIIERIFYENILPLAIKLNEKSKIFRNYFFSHQSLFWFHYYDTNEQKYPIDKTSNNHEMVLQVLVSDQTNSIEKIEIDIQLRQFKSPENSFNFNLKLTTVFEEFYYKLFFNNELFTTKLYHEKLTSNDIKRIIEKFVSDLRSQSNENL
jgi:hypothetical protein